MKPFVTIAIPTYNRANILDENLSLFIDSVDSDIEIVVSDNASDDSTEEVCSKYDKKHENFKYYRNPQNIGYDRNVLSCVEKSSGEYIWFLSDDDFLNPLLISEIVSELKKEKPDGALINATVVNPVTGQVIIENLGGCDKDFVTIVGSNEFVAYSKWGTLISSIIIRQSIIKKDMLPSFVGTCFIQVPLFWRAINGKRIYIFGTKKIIKNDATSDNFNMHSSRIWLLNWIATISSLKDAFTAPRCKEAATNLYSKPFYMPGSFVMHCVQARSSGILDKHNKKLVIDGVDLSIPESCFVNIIACIPVFFVDKLFAILRRIARRVRDFCGGKLCMKKLKFLL